MNRIIAALLFGILVGILDVIPMVLQGLTWDANLSAFFLWIVVGFFIATTKIKLAPVLKGILIALLVLLPSAFIIAWKNPLNLIPVLIMTLILGGLLGWLIEKFCKEK
ncbi:MAG: hypothetical protein GXO77_14360 [Calditrichaeota bacterium]|nr:hypothetical protein [Calditrichota bacterium]